MLQEIVLKVEISSEKGKIHYEEKLSSYALKDIGYEITLQQFVQKIDELKNSIIFDIMGEIKEEEEEHCSEYTDIEEFVDIKIKKEKSCQK